MEQTTKIVKLKTRSWNIRLNRSRLGNAIVFTILFIYAAFMALPLIYSISQSLKPLDELWFYPPRFLVNNPTLKNFKDLFLMMGDGWVPFSRYVFNTFFVSIVGTSGHIILSSLAAYALAKHKFPLQEVLFKIVVFSLMYSTAVTAVPSFLILSNLKLIDTYGAIIIPSFASSLGLYMMKQFISVGIPDSLLEAARIDGANEWKLFWRIVMPLVKPAWLTLMIFSFNGLWNVTAGTTIRSEHLKMLNYALQQIVNSGIGRSGVAAAATIFMMVVPVVLFIITQSQIIETMATSGMKD